MVRKDFHHPFEPYDIQQQFMEAVYNCIENGKVGIFESPTGTGKSLSLICGSLTWLREHKRKTFDEAVAAVQVDDDEPEWMVEHARETRRKEARQMKMDFEARLNSVRDREQQVRKGRGSGEPPFKRRKQASDAPAAVNVDEEKFVLDDYESEDEKRRAGKGQNDYSTETTKLMEKLGMLQRPRQDRFSNEDQDELKIFFCSRTHSQLSQFVGELKRVKMPPGLPPTSDETDDFEALKHLTLGSRKNLCINPSVSKLISQTAVNERCMEMQQSKTPADQTCPYLPNKETEELVLDFRDHALAEIRDIEDLANVGRKLQICPYYASRPAIDAAEMVTLPYPLLLQKSAREALAISLKGHVVIIDEAHNLINAVEGTYSAQISENQLNRARECLMTYLQKFRSRLKGSNRVYVTQVIRVLDSLLLAIAGFKPSKETGGTAEPGELLAGKGVDQVNLAKLVRYISDSRLARKVEGYVAHVKQVAESRDKTADVPVLTQVQNFLMTLMNPSKEGRFFWSKEPHTIVLRYLLLDPSEHFRDVVEDARAVVLAGGTMSPMNEYQQQLFPYLPSVETLSCGHLVSRNNLLVRTITTDNEGPLDFSFKGRNQSASIARLGRAIQDVASLVTGGLIVFFPSYGFLNEAMDQWKKVSLLDTLNKIKPTYHDDRNATSTENIFKSYSESITSNSRKGAILLSVLGGKLSEGINFSDDLGRCVMVVGLPFPNLETPEWKAKMKFLEDKAVARGQQGGGKASREYAENVCMRSVNQAIGRVIRHRSDWAGILLMDARFGQERIGGKLPGWIREGLPRVAEQRSRMEDVLVDLTRFFEAKYE